jgi:hypothetical protein
LQPCPHTSNDPFTRYDLISEDASAKVHEALNCENLGHALYADIIKSWYRINTFVIMDLAVTAKFADSDIWQARVPPRSFVRHIQLTIDEWQLKRELDGRHSPQLRQLRGHLKLLEQFSHGTKFTIYINTTHCERDGSTVEDGDERPHECKLWKRYDLPIFEFVGHLWKVLFDIFLGFVKKESFGHTDNRGKHQDERKTGDQDNKQTGADHRGTKIENDKPRYQLVIILDQDLELNESDTEVDYEKWCRRFFDHQEVDMKREMEIDPSDQNQKLAAHDAGTGKCVEIHE